MKRFLTIAGVELKLAMRSPDNILFAMIMPLVVMFVHILIFQNSTSFKGDVVTELLPAWMAINIAALGLMSMPLNLSEYRSRKILLRYKVTPSTPSLLLGGQIAAQSVMALISALLVSVTAALFFGFSFNGNLISFVGSYVLSLLGIFSLGMILASLAKDSKQAVVLSCIVYFPMIIFSGAFIPIVIFPAKVQALISILPLKNCIALMSSALRGSSLVEEPLSLAVLVLASCISVPISLKFFRWEYK